MLILWKGDKQGGRVPKLQEGTLPLFSDAVVAINYVCVCV